MDAQVLTGKILTGCHLTGFLVGSILEDLKCLIKSGVPQNATFERTGDVVTTGGTFGPNEVVTLSGKMYHHGQVTDTLPTYDVSPLVRPTAPDVYDTAASAPNPDKHGLNWEFSDPKNDWVWDLLDGRADGTQWAVNGDFSDGTNDWNSQLGAILSVTNQQLSIESVGPNSVATQTNAAPITDRVQIDSTVISGIARTEYGGVVSPVYAPGIYSQRIQSGRTNSKFDLAPNVGTTAVFDCVSIKTILPATGTLNLKSMSVVPAVTEWQTTGDFNILSGATGNQILSIESGTGLICATDGTNTCKSHTAYAAGTDHLVSLVFGDGNMQIVMDGTKGGIAPFVGTFTPGETLKWGLNNEDIFSKGDVCGSTTATFGEAVELAQELAFTL